MTKRPGRGLFNFFPPEDPPEVFSPRSREQPWIIWSGLDPVRGREGIILNGGEERSVAIEKVIFVCEFACGCGVDKRGMG